MPTTSSVRQRMNDPHPNDAWEETSALSVMSSPLFAHRRSSISIISGDGGGIVPAIHRVGDLV